ncbi:MAG: DUF4388 domain-containing protein [Acidobacteriota bacterium]|nr:DUF4388 domain-containing protein [Acidobacteriota bacterium]MDH3785304.1 DUF4388 domain-containing protein [Acidobacteriota bacterium]
MKLTGMLAIMSLPDLLQWIMYAEKTGCLRVARKGVSRDIYCREGRIIACTSDDPAVFLGQFLISRGHITEETLSEGLRRQEVSGKSLGLILIEMGVATEGRMKEIVEEKAMETIHGLFDWEDASFEFTPDVTAPEGRIEVDLNVQEVLLDGMRRLDEMTRMRAVFTSPEIILERTEQLPESDELAKPMMDKLYDAIDGRRTLGEIVLLAHTSEYAAYKLLHALHESDCVRIGHGKSVPPVLIDQEPALARAGELLEQGKALEAVELLGQLAEANPNDATIKRILGDAEAQFVVQTYEEGLQPEDVPRLRRPLEELATEGLSHAESHLLERIDGIKNIKSIMWVVPLRPVEVLAAFKQLLERQLIDLNPAPSIVETVAADS